MAGIASEKIRFPEYAALNTPESLSLDPKLPLVCQISSRLWRHTRNAEYFSIISWAEKEKEKERYYLVLPREYFTPIDTDLIWNVNLPTMSAQTRISWTPKLLRFLTDSPRYLWRRYTNLRPWGKAFFWSLVVFYIVLATVFIVLTPARIFQWFYDLAQKLSSLRFGWLALGGIVGSSWFGSSNFITHQIIRSNCLLSSLHRTLYCLDAMWICIWHERSSNCSNCFINWFCSCLLEFPILIQQTPSSLEYWK